jgi:hypothetical protein
MVSVDTLSRDTIPLNKGEKITYRTFVCTLFRAKGVREFIMKRIVFANAKLKEKQNNIGKKRGGISGSWFHTGNFRTGDKD